MRGESSWYERVVGVLCTHFPAILGVSVGATIASRWTGEEKVSEIVVFVGTFWAPAVGIEDVRAKLRFECDVDAAEPWFELVPCDPEGPDVDVLVVNHTTAAITTAAPAKSTHGRRRNGLSDLDSRTFMASACIDRAATRIRRRPA
jgi:hypothetical protein